MSRQTQPINPQTGLPLAFYGLDIVAKFQNETVASFTAKYGQAPEPYVYGKPIKRWRDPRANPALPNPPEFLLYKVATAQNGAFQADGDGLIEPVDIGMSAAEAWAVNIPPDIGLGTIPGTTPTSEVRMPIELLPNERLQRQPFGGGLRVKRVDVPDAPSAATSGSFTEIDRAALYTVLNWVNAQKARG